VVSKMKKKTNRECVLGKCEGHYLIFFSSGRGECGVRPFFCAFSNR